MSTISDWKADYTGADTNIPQADTAIPFPPDGTTDLGAMLRDAKAVVRQESLNKGWEPDSWPAEFVDERTFRINTTTNLLALYPPDIAVKCDLGSSTVYSWVASARIAASDPSPGNPTLFDFALNASVLTNSLTTVTFSAFKPPSSVDRHISRISGLTYSIYPYGRGSALPQRVTQFGAFRVAGSAANSATVMLAREEFDTAYRLLLQTVDSTGSPADGAYRVVSVSRETDSIAVTFASAPGALAAIVWEYCIIRGS